MEFKSISEKAAYLLGILKGRGDNDEVSTLMGEILVELAGNVDTLSVGYQDLADRVDNLDEDLNTMAEDIYKECSCTCGCGDDDDDEASEADFDDEDMYEVVCPNCHDTVYLNEGMLEEGTISCPNCGEPLELSVEGLIDEE